MTGIGSLCISHLRYMQWADEIYFGLPAQFPAGKAEEDTGISFQSFTGTLQHIYKAELLWFRRVRNDLYPKLDDISIPDHSDQWRELWTGLHLAWLQWADEIANDEIANDEIANEGAASGGNSGDNSAWEEIVVHRTSSGLEMRFPRWQVVMHLVNHGSYHRGQLASLLRQAGLRPPSTDLAAFYRTR